LETGPYPRSIALTGAAEEASKQATIVDPSVGWVVKQHKEYKFCRFKPLDFSGLTPHAFDAEKLLKKLATDPGICDIMVEYEWTVRVEGGVD
jgi:hypothetical protein